MIPDRGGVAMLRKILLGIFFAFVLAGCTTTSDSGEWNLPETAGTGIDPTVGGYSFSATGCFSVIEEAGRKYVRFSEDCARYDKIEIVNGAFFNEWGEIDGMHCPSDGYAISGAFNSKTDASGTIMYAFDCKIYRTESFSATLK